MKNSVKSNIRSNNLLFAFTTDLVIWSILAVTIGLLVGSCAAFFLYTLETVTQYRTNHLSLIYFLPLAGLVIGLLYFYYGKSVETGNHLLVKEYQHPQAIIPFKMVPLILSGTLITHLFGGSAGREGTAVQIGAAISDQFSRFFHLNSLDRKILIAMGISAGFAAVFGTPWAGTVFAIEILVVGKLRYKTFIPCLISAFVAHYICLWWSIKHTVYPLSFVPDLSISSLSLSLLCGVVFGITAWFFIKSTELWVGNFKKLLTYPPLRPFFGGSLFLLIYLLIGDPKYIGLGIPTITQAFEISQGGEVFLLKILFTSLTLGAGFKGGEVTPLFFIGATLGSFLSSYLNLPISFVAALGFVAVFAGATKAPWACTLMGIELFGAEATVFLLLSCWAAAFFSGTKNLYNSPPHPQISLLHAYLKNWLKKTNLFSSR